MNQIFYSEFCIFLLRYGLCAIIGHNAYVKSVHVTTLHTRE
nr:MAG TPA: hypothetical protein [Caudoviricetes sp.]